MNSPYPTYPTSPLRPHFASFAPVATLEEILFMSRDEKIKTHIQSFVKLTNARSEFERESSELTYLGTKYCV